MSFLDDLKKKFSAKKDDKTFDIDVTLGNGNIVTVVTEAEQPQVGDPVVDDTGAPVADAEHLLPDGGSIVTVGGNITEIKDAPPAGDPQEPTMSEVMNSIKNIGAQFASFKKTVEKSQKDNEEAFGIMTKEFERMGKEITSKEFQKPSGEQGSGGDGKGKAYDADKAKEIREKRNEK